MDSQKALNDLSKIKIIDLVRKEGVFETETQSIPYKTYKIKFQLEGNSLVYEAKVDKIFKEYIQEDLDRLNQNL